MKIRKIRVTNEGLISALIIQFFIYQLLKMGISPTGGWYLPFIVKGKFFFNSVFGFAGFSVGDVLYCVLVVVLLYWLVRGIRLFIKKDKTGMRFYSVKILLTLNVMYAVFMLSFGILYDINHFSQYKSSAEKLHLNELKIVANQLLNDCRDLREQVTTNKDGEFSVDQKKIIGELYQEQSTFYGGIPLQKTNVKKSLFSPIMKKIGVLGYYNPFTGEAQIVEGYPDTSIPFTIAHELGHQVGVAKEDEANFYSFYMGESSVNKEFQYSVKYKALNYVLREIYVNDSTFVKRVVENYSEGMKKDRKREKRFYSEMSVWGSDAFSYMNNMYLISNNQEGIITYNQVVKMIVSFYKQSYPSYFTEEISGFSVE